MAKEEKTKKFLVFAMMYRMECGGWRDFRGSFDTIEEAQKLAFEWLDGKHDEDFQGYYTQVVDLETGQCRTFEKIGTDYFLEEKTERGEITMPVEIMEDGTIL